MCGVIGLISKEDISMDLYSGLWELQHRGQDSAGFFLYDSSKRDYRMIKGIGLISNEITPSKLENILEGITPTVGIGQVRYPTIGRTTESERRRDAQPTYASTPGFAMVHNGNIANISELRNELITERRYFKSECDVEVVNLLLAEEVSRLTNSGEITKEILFEGVKNIMNKLKGSYSALTIIRDVGFLAFRDPYAIRPLVMGRKEDGSIAFASESVALSKIGYEFAGSLRGGQVAFIPEGTLEMEIRTVVEEQRANCMFEEVYFARPSSIVNFEADNSGNRNPVCVYDKRIRLGEVLGEEMLQDAPEVVRRIDRIAPVPDTSRPAANSLARILGKQYFEVFDKNRYSMRTFIAPGKRKDLVKSKLIPIKSAVDGYSIGIVDDSIVRGNTSKTIVDMLRDAGATEVHFIVASPPIAHPCHLGIDMPTEEELIASRMNIDEIREFIGADSLTYLSIEGLKKVLGDNRCYGCINGDYPVPPVESYKSERIIERNLSK